MGREAKTEYADKRERTDVKAHLDSLSLRLTGGKKLTLPLAEVRAATVDGDELRVVAGALKFSLRLGAKEAAAWAKTILNPPTLADKLGVKPDKTVVLVGAVAREVVEAAKAAKSVTTSARLPAAGKAIVSDVVVLQLSAGNEAAQIAAAARALGAATALWFVYAKGGVVNGDHIIALARKTGLKDTKVARVSASHAALRFIRGKRSAS
jgi:hypothetical protein